MVKRNAETELTKFAKVTQNKKALRLDEDQDEPIDVKLFS
jgi:hypothetical protein